jgi:hypothetical protein
MRWVSADTTSDAMAKEFEVLRGMDVSQRAVITFDLSDNLRQIIEAGVRHRNPRWDDQAVKREVMRLMLGEHIFQEVFGHGSKVEQRDLEK